MKEIEEEVRVRTDTGGAHVDALRPFVQMAKTQKNKATSYHLGRLKGSCRSEQRACAVLADDALVSHTAQPNSPSFARSCWSPHLAPPRAVVRASRSRSSVQLAQL